MTSARTSRAWCTIPLIITIFSLILPAYAKYSGGNGEPNNPYQIATAEDLMLLGDSPEDSYKHFILTADIDLDPNLPGRKVFDRAVIEFFTGVFDGDGHTISHLTIKSGDGIALFGSLGFYSIGEVRGVGLVDVNITGSGFVGGLVSSNWGTVIQCYSTGTVSGNEFVGGLVGSVWGMRMGGHGTVSHCYSTVAVSGSSSVGGLVGELCDGCILTQCYSTGMVNGNSEVGGLVGYSDYGNVNACFWDIQTSGQTESAGGTGKTTAEMQDIRTYPVAEWDFLGRNEDGLHEFWQMPPEGGYPVLTAFSRYVLPHLPGMGSQEDPYLISDAEQLGAMIHYSPKAYYQLVASIDLSGICWSTSVIPSFDGIFDGNGYIISHLTVAGDSYLGLFGELGANAKVSNLGLEAVDVNGTGIEVGGLVGTNNGSIINCYSTGSVTGDWRIGGLVGSSSRGSNVAECYSTGAVSGREYVGGLIGANGENVANCHSTTLVSGSEFVGGLVGYNWDGSIAMSYSTGTVTGYDKVGGLVGQNYEGSITDSSSNGTVIGNGYIGGLVGVNADSRKGGNITNCYNTGTVTASENNVGGLVGYNGWEGGITTSYNTGGIYANDLVGGLVGTNWGDITASYNNGMVSGNESVGGLVGFNYISISNSYSSGRISADVRAGGLVGYNYSGIVNVSFWDVQTSGQNQSDGGTGKTRAEMQTASTFLEAGWDFVGETVNGTEDIWKIAEGLGYPHLSWEKYSGGTGEPNDPCQISTAEDLITLGETPEDYDKHFILTADIDLDPNLPGRKVLDRALITPDTDHGTLWDWEGTVFKGVFDGDGHTISHLTIEGGGYLGLFGRLESLAKIENLGVVDVNITGAGGVIGGLLGGNRGSLIQCYSTGIVRGTEGVGGLAGNNSHGTMSQCYSNVTVTGIGFARGIGGLAGGNSGVVTQSYSTGAVSGGQAVGGLVGSNAQGSSSITECYSTASVSGNSDVGGLIGLNGRYSLYDGPDSVVTHCYSTGVVNGTEGRVGGLVGSVEAAGVLVFDCFWDNQTSGRPITQWSEGMGKTTAEMKTAKTFLEAGWDFVDEAANGSEDIWWILEGQDYPRLWWEAEGN